MPEGYFVQMSVNIRSLIEKAPTAKIKAWLKILGPPFISLTIVVCLLGGAISYHNGSLNIPLLVMTLIGLVCIHFSASCFNDYFDYLSGNDEVNQNITPFSGGSRVIQQATLGPKTIFIGGCALVLIGTFIGLILSYLRGWPVFLLGILGVFLAVGYVEPHINLSARGLGELAVFLGFGPLMVVGTYYVQTLRFELVPLYVGVIMGFLAALVLWINEIPDYEADESVGKKNLVVRFGKKKSAIIFASMLPAVFILTIFGVVMKLLPVGAVFVFLLIPVAYKAARCALLYYNDIRILPANASTIALILGFGIIFIIAFIFSPQTIAI